MQFRLVALVIVTLVVMFAGCQSSNVENLIQDTEQESPTKTDVKPLISFIIKEGDDRTVTVKCHDGTTFVHNYTMDQRYICPNGTVVEDQIKIAVIKNGVILVPLTSIISGFQGYGLETRITEVLEEEPVSGSPRWKGTMVRTYNLQSDKGSITWSEKSSNLIEVNGEIQEITKPFKEMAEYVAFYDDEPRYKNTIAIGRGSATVKSAITYVPLKDFVEPLGYKVKQSGNIVAVFK